MSGGLEESRGTEAKISKFFVISSAVVQTQFSLEKTFILVFLILCDKGSRSLAEVLSCAQLLVIIVSDHNGMHTCTFESKQVKPPLLHRLIVNWYNNKKLGIT